MAFMRGERMQIWDPLLRVAVAFAGLVIWSRIIGKKLISHMTFFDFVAGVTFGSVGGNLMFNHQVPIWTGVMELSAFSLLTLLSDYICLKSLRGRHLLQGKPKVVFAKGRINMHSLKQSRLTVDDLLMLLRKKDVFYLDEIESAYFETDGTISVMKKPGNMTVTCSDLGLRPKPSGMPDPCIMEGHIFDNNLVKMGKDRNWLNKSLGKKNVKAEDVLFAQVNREDELYYSPK